MFMKIGYVVFLLAIVYGCPGTCTPTDRVGNGTNGTDGVLPYCRDVYHPNGTDMHHSNGTVGCIDPPNHTVFYAIMMVVVIIFVGMVNALCVKHCDDLYPDKQKSSDDTKKDSKEISLKLIKTTNKAKYGSTPISVPESKHIITRQTSYTPPPGYLISKFHYQQE